MHLISRLLLIASLAFVVISGVSAIVIFHPWSTILVVLLILGRLRKAKDRVLDGHGTARFATQDEMQERGML